VRANPQRNATLHYKKEETLFPSQMENELWLVLPAWETNMT